MQQRCKTHTSIPCPLTLHSGCRPQHAVTEHRLSSRAKRGIQAPAAIQTGHSATGSSRPCSERAKPPRTLPDTMARLLPYLAACGAKFPLSYRLYVDQQHSTWPIMVHVSPPPGVACGSVSDSRQTGVSRASRHEAEAVAEPEARALRGPHVTGRRPSPGLTPGASQALRKGQAAAGLTLRAPRRLPSSGNAVRTVMESTMSDAVVMHRPNAHHTARVDRVHAGDPAPRESCASSARNFAKSNTCNFCNFCTCVERIEVSFRSSSDRPAHDRWQWRFRRCRRFRHGSDRCFRRFQQAAAGSRQLPAISAGPCMDRRKNNQVRRAASA